MTGPHIEVGEGASKSEEIMIIPGLPDDLSLSILARVPYSRYSSLAQTCKSWRAAVAGDHLYEVRREQGSTQKLLAVLPEQSREKSFHVYNPESDTWRCLKPLEMLQGSAMEGFACCAVGRLLFILGGSQKGTVLSEVHVYDLLRSEWSTRAAMTSARSWFACGVVGRRGGARGPSIIVAGGQGAVKALKEAEMYDVAADQWEPITDMQVARSCHGGLVVGGGEEFWAVAGEVVVRHDLDDRPLHARKGSAEVYSWQSDSWRFVADMWPDWKKVPAPLASVGASLYTIHDGVLKRYHPATATWTVCGPSGYGECYRWRIKPARAGFAFVGVGRCLYAVGGMRESWRGRNEYLKEELSCLEVCSIDSGCSSLESEFVAESGAGFCSKGCGEGEGDEKCAGGGKEGGQDLTWRSMSEMIEEGRGVMKASAVLEV